MARLLRVEYPSVLYHVTTRGNARSKVCSVSYDDLLVDGEAVHLFVDFQTRQVLHVKFKQSDLKELPTKAKLDPNAQRPLIPISGHTRRTPWTVQSADASFSGRPP